MVKYLPSSIVMVGFIVALIVGAMIFVPGYHALKEMTINQFKTDSVFDFNEHRYYIIYANRGYINVREETGKEFTINLNDESFSTLWSIKVNETSPIFFDTNERMSLILNKSPKYKVGETVLIKIQNEEYQVTICAVYNRGDSIVYDLTRNGEDGSVIAGGWAWDESELYLPHEKRN